VDAARALELHGQRIRACVADARVFLTGSASIDTLDARDVDLVVLVDDVRAAAAALESLYPRLYPEQWRDDWIAFREPGPPQVDVVVTHEGSGSDAQHRLAWNHLRDDEALLAEYLALKADAAQLEERKRAFFDRLVDRLGG